MSADDWKSTIGNLAEIGFSGVQFIGGEPMIHPDLKELVRFSRSVGMKKVEVYTNGTRIDEGWIKFFQDHEVSLAISFYSFDPKFHLAITKNSSSFTRTINAIKLVVEAEIPLRIGIISMEENEQTISETIRALRTDFGITNVRVDKNREIGRGRAGKDKDEVNLFGQLCGACGSNKASIDNKGNIYPCVFSHDHLLGNVKDQNWVDRLIDPLDTFLGKMNAELEARQDNVTAICRPFGGSCGPDQKCGPDDECSPTPPPGGPCP